MIDKVPETDQAPLSPSEGVQQVIDEMQQDIDAFEVLAENCKDFDVMASGFKMVAAAVARHRDRLAALAASLVERRQQKEDVSSRVDGEC